MLCRKWDESEELDGTSCIREYGKKYIIRTIGTKMPPHIKRFHPVKRWNLFAIRIVDKSIFFKFLLQAITKTTG